MDQVQYPAPRHHLPVDPPLQPDQNLQKVLKTSENPKLHFVNQPPALPSPHGLENAPRLEVRSPLLLARATIAAGAAVEGVIARSTGNKVRTIPTGVPPLNWSTNWDRIIPFQEDQRWLERETNPKRSC